LIQEAEKKNVVCEISFFSTRPVPICDTICCVEEYEWKDGEKLEPGSLNYDADDIPSGVSVSDTGREFILPSGFPITTWAALCELVCFNFERFGCNAWNLKTLEGKCKIRSGVSPDGEVRYKEGDIRSDFCPTASPTVAPSDVPTLAPVDPTPVPSTTPTESPTGNPTAEPTKSPLDTPVPDPTAEPTPSPVGEPTAEPTRVDGVTDEPTASPVDGSTPAPVDNGGGAGQEGGASSEENDSILNRDSTKGRTYYVVVFSMGGFLFIVLLGALFWMSKKDSTRKETANMWAPTPVSPTAGIQMADAGGRTSDRTGVTHTQGFEPKSDAEVPETFTMRVAKLEQGIRNSLATSLSSRETRYSCTETSYERDPSPAMIEVNL